MSAESKTRRVPAWAAAEMTKLRLELDEARQALARTEQAHAVLTGRDWTSLPGPGAGVPEVYHLWMLYPDDPRKVCSLRRGDTLLIGRARKHDD